LEHLDNLNYLSAKKVS